MSRFLSKLRFAQTNLQKSKNLDTGHVYVLVFGSRSERLSESTTTPAGVGVMTNILSRPCSPTLWDRLGQVGLGQLGLNIGWDRWDWDRGVFVKCRVCAVAFFHRGSVLKCVLRCVAGVAFFHRGSDPVTAIR